MKVWTEGALAAVVLHLAFAAAIVLATRFSEHAMLDRPELAVDLDMGFTEVTPTEPTTNGNGGGAGGAIASAVPLPADVKPLGPLVPPDMIEPVEGAPVARTSGPPPIGYGAGFGGGMGGGVGGGIGSGVVTPPAPPPVEPAKQATPPMPELAGAYYTDISLVQYMRLIEYPQESLDSGEEGRGILEVIVSRDGTVNSWRLKTSTGVPRLDAEIKRVAGRIRSLDPLPADFPGRRASVNIPIVFRIRDQQ